MKKFLSLILTILLFCGTSFAKSKKSNLPAYKFNGGEYYLYYSAKNEDSGGYINEYYKANQSYTSWKDLIAVWHYPNSYSPIDQAKEYKEILGADGITCNIETDEDENTAIIDFTLLATKKLPIIVEYNIFKFAKYDKCGSVGFQYAKRYRINSALEINKVKKDIEKNRKKIIKKVNKAKVPVLFSDSVDEGRLKSHEGTNQNHANEFN